MTRAHSLAREIFSGIANKWTLLVVSILGERTLRFTQLRGEVEGISHKMLTQTLRGLERDGLVERTVYPTVPPRVEYALTDAGQALRHTVYGIAHGPAGTWNTSRNPANTTTGPHGPRPRPSGADRRRPVADGADRAPVTASTVRAD